MPAKTKEGRPETKGRPTLYRGIQMRSRLEADYAAYLDRKGRQWEYEPDCYADENGQWLPDFRITFEDGDRQLVEVKPAQLLVPGEGECRNCVVRRVDGIIDRTRVAWSTEPGIGIEIAFWTYGAAMTDLSIVGHRQCGECRSRGTWVAKVPGIEFMFAWPGQEQLHELEDHPDLAVDGPDRDGPDSASPAEENEAADDAR